MVTVKKITGGNNTIKRFCVWTENGFAECDKMGKIKEGVIDERNQQEGNRTAGSRGA